jgi:hypothetical protein
MRVWIEYAHDKARCCSALEREIFFNRGAQHDSGLQNERRRQSLRIIDILRSTPNSPAIKTPCITQIVNVYFQSEPRFKLVSFIVARCVRMSVIM